MPGAAPGPRSRCGYNGQCRRAIDLCVATIAPLAKTASRRVRVQKRTATPELSRGLLAGAAGGLLGAWVMVRFANLWSNIAETGHTRLGTREEWDAASNVVDIVSRSVIKVKLRPRRKRQATAGLHYIFGTLLGAAYGALVELEPAVGGGTGAPFGALEWLLGSKLTAPRFGLVRPRAEYSPQERLQTFAAHVVFGVTTELARRSVRREL